MTRAHTVNFRTRFLVYCSECHVTEFVESLREAETLRELHVCAEPTRLDLAELGEVCRC